MLDFLKREREDEIIFADTEEIKILTAEDAMVKPTLIDEEEDSSKILRKLKREDVDSCIVIDKEGKIIGEISDQDIIKIFLYQTKFEPLVQYLDMGYKEKVQYKTAGQLAKKVKTVSKKTPVKKILSLMCKEKFVYIPVVDENKKVIGVITPSSIINLLEKY